MKTFKSIDRTLNMCDSCSFCISYCDQEVELGEGIGDDNVIECPGYDPKDEIPESIEPVNL